jgi:hypothetical protein
MSGITKKALKANAPLSQARKAESNDDAIPPDPVAPPTESAAFKAARDDKATARSILRQIGDSVRRLNGRRPAPRIAVALVATPLLLGMASYFLATLALDDIVHSTSEAAPLALSTDLAVRNGSAHLAAVSGDKVLTEDRLTNAKHSVQQPGTGAVELHLAGYDSAVVTTDGEGRVTMTTLNDRARPHDWFDNVKAHWRSVLWRPYLYPLASSVLDRMIQYVPFSIPPPGQLRRLGIYADCADCPEMMVVSRGFAVLSPGSHSDEGDQQRWRLALTKATFAVSLVPVSDKQWARCVADGACKSHDEPGLHAYNLEDAKSYLTWLNKLTKRNYRMISAEEWEALIQTHSSNAAGNLLNQDTNSSVWVCDNSPKQAMAKCRVTWTVPRNLENGYRLTRKTNGDAAGEGTALIILASDRT